MRFACGLIRTKDIQLITPSDDLHIQLLFNFGEIFVKLSTELNHQSIVRKFQRSLTCTFGFLRFR